MKKLKKINYLFLFASFFILSGAQITKADEVIDIDNIDLSSKPGTSEDGGNSSGDTSVDNQDITNEGMTSQERTKCSEQNLNNLTLEFVSSLLDNKSGFTTNVVDRNGKKALHIRTENIMTVCLDLDFALSKNNDKYYVSAKNNLSNSHDEYLNCLKKEHESGKKIFKKDGEKWVIDRSSKDIKKDSLEFYLDLEVDGKLTDGEVLFASRKPAPDKLRGKPVYSENFVSSKSCRDYEKLQNETVWVRTEQSEILDNYEKICQSGDLQQIKKALDDLQKSGLGNAPVIEKILSEAIENIIGEELKSLAREISTVRTKEELDQMDLARFSELLEDVEKYVLDPLSRQIALEFESMKGKSPSEKEKIKKSIKSLTAKMNKYAILTGTINKFDKFGQFDLATLALRVDSKARYFGRVGAANGLTPKVAQARHVKAVEQYEKKIPEKQRRFDTAEGNVTGYSSFYERRAESVAETRDQSFQRYLEGRQKRMKACTGNVVGYVNKSKCERAIKQETQAQSRLFKAREQYNNKIQQYMSMSSDYERLEEIGRETRSRREEYLFGDMEYGDIYGLSNPSDDYSLLGDDRFLNSGVGVNTGADQRFNMGAGASGDPFSFNDPLMNQGMGAGVNRSPTGSPFAPGGAQMMGGGFQQQPMMMGGGFQQQPMMMNGGFSQSPMMMGNPMMMGGASGGMNPMYFNGQQQFGW